MMILQTITSAFPERQMTQMDVWELLGSSKALERVSSGSARLLERVLKGDSGIDTRSFGYPDLERVFSASPDDLARGFEEAAPCLAGRALEKALVSAGMVAGDVDALFISTCTGYLCPGVTSHVAEQLAMREDACLHDLAGLGCAAALPMLRSAEGFLATNPGATVACVAVEICSAAFYLDDDPGQLISLCLFGDGASASLWSDAGRGWAVDGFSSLHLPQAREKIRFVKEGGGYLKNKLSPEVPDYSARAVERMWERSEGLPRLRPVLHGGGRDVLTAIEMRLGLAEDALAEERSVLRSQGNMSSPSVLVALERKIQNFQGQEGEGFWLCGFGAGFSAHAANLRAPSSHTQCQE